MSAKELHKKIKVLKGTTPEEQTELNNLIQIRQYVANSINFPNVNRPTVNQLNDLLLMLDKKIIGILISDNFKNYINYDELQEAKQEARDLSNIYHGRPPL